MEGYQRLSAVIGLCTMVFGVGLLAVPALGTLGPVDVILENITDSGPEQVLLLTGAVAIGYLAIGLRRPSESPERSPDRRRFDRATAATVEGESADRRQPVAGDLDTDIDAAIESGGRPLRAVRDELRRTVVGVYTDLYGTSEQAARETVDSGEWCHDPVASAFLAGESFPLGKQFRLFLAPKRERRRRIERTIAAIEELEQR